MLTSSVVLLLACAAFITYDTVTFRRDLVEDVSVLASAVGDNCAAAIDFNDPKTAADTLAALRVRENILSACLYSHDGRVFAVYQRDHATVFMPPPMQAAGQQFTGEQLHLFRAVEHKGEVVGTIFVASDLNDLSARLVHYTGIAVVVFMASLLVALALSSRLQRFFSQPILQLAQVARLVAREKNYSVRATRQNNDEIGELVDGFNEMLAQIQKRDIALQMAREEREKRAEERAREREDIHQQLVDASRRGGMAEIASNVLHNVGNVLNSVNISAGLIADNIRKSKVSNLNRVVILLREHAHDLEAFIAQDARGKHLPAYLVQLFAQLMAEQAAITRELDSLRRNIEHIKEIVAMQQSYATFGGVKENVDLASLVEDSVLINESSLNRHDVEIIRELEPMPLMNVEKHKVLQILVNLLRNAKYACLESERADKRLTVRMTSGGGCVRITVVDNGVGIPPENMTRIFNHGFTTRNGGHGFGLHSGALAAKEIGGSLTAHSDGPGQGATFILELPQTAATTEGTFQKQTQMKPPNPGGLP
jgi:signal transduction histidine kinase